MLSVVGLSALLASYASALRIIKLAGGSYLLWLAYKSFRSAAGRHDIEARTLAGATLSPFRCTIRGLPIQTTNRKAALACIPIISRPLRDGAPLWAPVLVALRA